MRIGQELLREIVAHAEEDPRIECCGVVAVRPGTPPQAARVYRAANIHASALKFEIEPGELLRLYRACEEDGCELGAIYHSHVRSAPYPSQTDIGFAARWPGIEWIIVGLAGGGEPEVRSYLIEGAEVSEVALEAALDPNRG